MTSILKVDTIQDADGNNIINENSNTITIGASGDTTNIIGTLQNDGAAVGGANTPAFLAYQSSGQVIADTTDTTINFQTEVYDTASAFSSNTFTCPSGEGGKYNFFFSISKDNFSATRFNVKLSVAGSEKAIVENASGGNYDSATGSVVLPVSAGDAVLLKCYQDSSGANNLLSGEKRTFFGGFKIIE